MVVKASEDDKIVTANQYIQEICMPLKCAENWLQRLAKKFGSLAETPAAERVKSYLFTKQGRQEICALCKENIPLHGLSSNVRGIAVCTELLGSGVDKIFFWVSLTGTSFAIGHR